MTEPTNLPQVSKPLDASIAENLVVKGDLKALTPTQRVEYYNYVCGRVGVDSAMRPFEFLELNGKVVLYARRECTDQLRSIRGISIEICERSKENDIIAVRAKATLPSGRCDEAIGAVGAKGLIGDSLANAMMKAETKAKRRVTLSICGLGFLDETEVEDIKPDRLGRERAKPVSMPEDDEATLTSTEPIPNLETK